MDAFIYFSRPTDYGLDQIEDALDVALSGVGEVTGSGTGKEGSNIDIYIENGTLDKMAVLALLRTALQRFGMPESTKVTIDDEKFFLSAG
jgi:hypothetical protein